MNWLPKHSCELSLTHNEHKSSYLKVEEWIELIKIEEDEWVSESERIKSTETGSIWQLQWYPDNPVGFYRVFASSLEAIKEHCYGMEAAWTETGDILQESQGV